MSVLTSLPVAPEFVEVLSENARTTALDALRKFGIPDDLINLVSSIRSLDAYLVDCYRTPEAFQQERDDHEAQAFIIDAINLIAKCGGIFETRYASSTPRELEKVRK